MRAAQTRNGSISKAVGRAVGRSVGRSVGRVGRRYRKEEADDDDTFVAHQSHHDVPHYRLAVLLPMYIRSATHTHTNIYKGGGLSAAAKAGNPLWRNGFLTIPHILVFLVGVHIYQIANERLRYIKITTTLTTTTSTSNSQKPQSHSRSCASFLRIQTHSLNAGILPFHLSRRLSTRSPTQLSHLEYSRSHCTYS